MKARTAGSEQEAEHPSKGQLPLAHCAFRIWLMGDSRVARGLVIAWDNDFSILRFRTRPRMSVTHCDTGIVGLETC